MSSCAVGLFFAIKNIPDVSLSNLCTGYGLSSLKILLFEKISIRFFFDFVPPWTDMPACLLRTIKSSLFSIIKFSFSWIIVSDGSNFDFLDIIFFLISKLCNSIKSFVWSLTELLIFFLLILILPLLRLFSIKLWGIDPNYFRRNLSTRIPVYVVST